MKEKKFKKEQNELIDIFCDITDKKMMGGVFSELFTPAELKDFTLRWALLKLLKKNYTQRDIASQLGISLCKITRGSRLIKNQKSLVNSILNTRFSLQKKQ